MPSKIILIYDGDCPNVEAARKSLRDAIAASGRSLAWREIDRADPATPWKYRQFGSPTILIDGQDVAGYRPGTSGDCCRVYLSREGRFSGAPAVDQIGAALALASRKTSGDWQGFFLAAPAVAFGLLPSVTCPACWPAYAALLGTLGVGFIPSDRLLLPLTVAALVLVVAVFAWRALRLRRFGAVVLGLAAATLLIVGRFVWPLPLMQYAGVVGLVAASIWNLRLRPRTAVQAMCPDCPPVVPLE